MKKIALLLACTLLLGLLTGCKPDVSKTEQSGYFMDAFDTFIQVVGYAESQEAFDGWVDRAHELFLHYHKLYDRFLEYSGMNNLRTVNLNAGVAPVQVEEALLDLLEFAMEQYEQTGGAINICMGAVTDVWRNHITMYGGEPEGELPGADILKKAGAHCDPKNLHIDRAAGTVYIADPDMILDVGSIAKGYAAQKVAEQLYAEGFTSFAISAGGNICVADGPSDGRHHSWSIGITDPDDTSASLDTVVMTHASLVTSGDYQRFYTVGGKRYHHITDPRTLYPADHYRAVTVLAPDSGEADAASTALFVLEPEEAKALAQKQGWEALWVYPDGTTDCTDGFAAACVQRGGARAELEKK